MDLGCPRLLILDRDGVLVQNVATYIRSWVEVIAIEGSFAAVAGFQRLGARVAVVTNQSPVSRGLIDISFVDAVNDWIRTQVARCGGTTDIPFYVCPHVPADGCGCRKPEPGLLHRAQRHAGVTPARSWMVGDHDSDIDAGIAAGCGAVVHVKSDRQPLPPSRASHHFPSLAALHAVVSTHSVRSH